MTLRSSVHVAVLAFSSIALFAVGCGDDSETTGSGGAGGSGTQSSTSTDGTGGGGDGGSGGGSTDPKTAYCEDEIAWETECDPGNVDTLEACLADGDTTCLFDGIRPGLGEVIGECVHARACDENDDDCYYDAGLVDPAEGQDEYIAACQAKLDECAEISDDYCAITIFTAERYAAMSACLDLACDAINDCLATEVEASCPEA
jgi:hypothetical protein